MNSRERVAHDYSIITIQFFISHWKIPPAFWGKIIHTKLCWLWKIYSTTSKRKKFRVYVAGRHEWLKDECRWTISSHLYFFKELNNVQRKKNSTSFLNRMESMFLICDRRWNEWIVRIRRTKYNKKASIIIISSIHISTWTVIFMFIVYGKKQSIQQFVSLSSSHIIYTHTLSIERGTTTISKKGKKKKIKNRKDMEMAMWYKFLYFSHRIFSSFTLL